MSGFSSSSSFLVLVVCAFGLAHGVDICGSNCLAARKHPHKYSGAHAQPTPIAAELPAQWNWCNVDGVNYCTASWNQHIPVYCGSCYVHGALSAANDRIKIMNRAQFQDIMLGRQVILNCGPAHGLGQGCGGGEGFDVFEFMHRFGLPDDTCANYAAQEKACDAEGWCANCMPVGDDIRVTRCFAVKSYTRYYARSYGVVSGEAAIMSEIKARGPVTCGLAATHAFDYDYHGGVFVDTTNATDMNHDVEVLGWGETAEGVKYWVARNSWGSYWGEFGGFFRVLRGANNMRIEEECTFVNVDISEMELFRNHSVHGSMKGLVAAQPQWADLEDKPIQGQDGDDQAIEWRNKHPLPPLRVDPNQNNHPTTATPPTPSTPSSASSAHSSAVVPTPAPPAPLPSLNGPHSPPRSTTPDFKTTVIPPHYQLAAQAAHSQDLTLAARTFSTPAGVAAFTPDGAARDGSASHGDRLVNVALLAGLIGFVLGGMCVGMSIYAYQHYRHLQENGSDFSSLKCTSDNTVSFLNWVFSCFGLFSPRTTYDYRPIPSTTNVVQMRVAALEDLQQDCASPPLYQSDSSNAIPPSAFQTDDRTPFNYQADVGHSQGAHSGGQPQLPLGRPVNSLKPTMPSSKDSRRTQFFAPNKPHRPRE